MSWAILSAMSEPFKLSQNPTLGEQADRLTAALREAEQALAARFRVPARVELPGGVFLEFAREPGGDAMRLLVGGKPFGLALRHVQAEAAFALDRLLLALEDEHAAAVKRAGEAAVRVEAFLASLSVPKS
jgi:hypothetical protein